MALDVKKQQIAVEVLRARRHAVRGGRAVAARHVELLSERWRGTHHRLAHRD
eukprot:COSAG06_NODE_4509_length_4193_cov_11.274792_1_plen_51_part_10